MSASPNIILIEATQMRNCTRTVSYLLCLFLPSLAASSEPRIVRVEEDWELVVTVPEPLQYSPQISTWMSPNDSLNNENFCTNFNHALRDDYVGGGFQTCAFDGTALRDDKVNRNGIKLSGNEELLKWTQVMAINNQELVFTIKEGTSQCWGDFGGPDSLVRIPTSLSNLNGYRPNRSAEWSGIGYGANRVSLLKLSKVRYITDQGQVIESTVNLQLK